MALERVLSWALALILAALLLALCLNALLGPEPNAVFGLIALKSGVAGIATTGRYLASGLQLVAVALLLWPRSRAIGAGAALLISLATAAMHLSPWLGVNLPMTEQLSAALASGATLEQIAQLPTDKGGLFLLTLASLILSAATLLIERTQVRTAARERRSAGLYA